MQLMGAVGTALDINEYLTYKVSAVRFFLHISLQARGPSLTCPLPHAVKPAAGEEYAIEISGD